MPPPWRLTPREGQAHPPGPRGRACGMWARTARQVRLRTRGGAADLYDRPVSTDTSTTRRPLGLRTSDLVTAAATGLLTLPDPARRTPATRFALRTAVAGTTGAGVWLGTDGDSALDLPSRAAFTAGAVGLVYGAAELGEAMDRALQRRLVRMGVRRPRLAMALAGVGASLAISFLERRAEATDEEDDAPEG